ncbi:putative holin-like toxin [Listeria innocua]
MSTYEVLTLMIAFGVLIIAILDSKNEKNNPLISWNGREWDYLYT